MRPRAPGVVAAATCALALGATGCGGDGGDDAHRGSLEWEKAPLVLRPGALPHDRIVVGRVRNTSSRILHLTAARLRILDANGHRLSGSSGFTASYAHGLFGAFQQPKELPRAELVRLGKILELPPKSTAPFFAAWRLAAGSREPVRIDYGAGTLLVPRASQPTPR